MLPSAQRANAELFFEGRHMALFVVRSDMEGWRVMGKRLDRLQELQHEENLQRNMDRARGWLTVLRTDGFALWRDGANIVVSPSRKLTDDRRQAIRELKPALLALLVVEDLRSE